MKAIKKMISVFLVLLLAGSVCIADVSPVTTTASAAVSESTIETKKLFKQSTTLSLNKEYAIVVKYDGRYYAVQQIDPETEHITDFTLPQPNVAYKTKNLATAGTRDVTNLIVEKDGVSYLTGVDDTVLWTGDKQIGTTGANQSGIRMRNNFAESIYKPNDDIYSHRYLYMGQVVKDGNYKYKSSSGTYSLWTLALDTRGVNYTYNTSKKTGELFVYGAGNYNYFLEFTMEDDGNGNKIPKFGNHAEYKPATTSTSSAEIILFEADNNSETVQVTKQINDSTYFSEKYTNYSWEYNGTGYQYQIIYKESQKPIEGTPAFVFIPTTTLKPSSAYVIAGGNQVLTNTLSTEAFDTKDASAYFLDDEDDPNSVNEEGIIDLKLCDSFTAESGSYWSTGEVVDSKQILSYRDTAKQNKESGTYIFSKDCALYTGSYTTACSTGLWDMKNEKLKCYPDETNIYFDGKGWVMLETLGNVQLYEAVLGTIVQMPADCIKPARNLYIFGYNGKTYRCEDYTGTELDPTNHYGLKSDSSKKGDPTCMKKGYEGATYCVACGAECGYEKEIPINPDNHSLGNVCLNDGTHAYKCINKSLTGEVCTYTIRTESCTNNGSCVCSVCGGDIPHIFNVEEASCLVSKFCTVCGKTEVQALGHMTSTTAAQIGDDKHGFVCSRCSTSVSEETCYDADNDCKCDICDRQLAHMPGSPATCLADQTCLVCGTVLNAKTAHSFTGSVKKTGNGTHQYRCVNNCGAYGTDTDGIGGSEVCTPDEDNNCKCTVCGYQLAHTPGADATCTTAQTCTVCSATIKAATGHSFTGEVKDNGDSTHSFRCANPGCEVYGTPAKGEGGKEACTPDKDNECKCTVCAHVLAHTPGDEATCTTDQLCLICGKVLTSASGHDFTGEAKANNDGTHSYKCKNDGCTAYGTVTEEGKQEKGGRVSCTADAENGCKCTECKYQLDHTSGAEATCTEARTCSVCGTELEAAAGHNFVGAAVSNEDGTHSYCCVNGACTAIGTEKDGVNGKADCTRNARNECKCSECGYQLAHIRSAEAPTCEQEVYCTQCRKTFDSISHSYTGTVTRCNNDGTHSYQCVNGCSGFGNPTACFDSTDDEDCKCDVCGYQMAHTPGAAATCTEDQLCSVCGTTIKAKLGHQFTANAVSDEAGHHAVKCARCDVTDTAADCFDTDRDCKCDVCGYQLAHQYNVEAATCFTSKYCTVCYHVEEEQLKHVFEGEARSNGNGTHSYACIHGCGIYGSIAACADHCGDCLCDECSYQFAHKSSGAADCENDEVCTVCGILIHEKLGHNFSGTAVYNEDGTHSVKCTRCDATDAPETCKKGAECKCTKCGHQYDHNPDGPATCLKDQMCLDCDMVLQERLPHEYAKVAEYRGNKRHAFPCVYGCGAFSEEADCVNSKEAGCKCPDCGHQFPHDEIVSEAVAPTCTETGLTEGRVCSICNTVIMKQEIVPATNHANAYLEKGTPATCTEDGIENGMYCPDCETFISGHGAIPAHGHEYVTDPAVAPNCTETGLTEGSHCKYCGDVRKPQEIVEKTGHNFGVTVLRNNCQTEGILLYTCKVCGYSYYGDSVPAGHYDNDDDGYCDSCGLDLGTHDHGTKDCSCMCHSTNAFSRFIYKIVLVFWKLFKTNKTCACGVKHY